MTGSNRFINGVTAGKHKRSLLFGLLSCNIGLVAGIYIRHAAIGDYDDFPYYAVVSSFLAPYTAWLFIVERYDGVTLKKGATAGIVGILFAHFLCLYFSLLVANIEYWVFDRQVGSLPGPPMDPLTGIAAIMLYTFFSHLLIGWFTIPAGACVGWLYARLRLKNANVA